MMIIGDRDTVGEEVSKLLAAGLDGLIFNLPDAHDIESVHLAGELFKLQTGTDMTHVPYRGSAPALTDLLAGHVDLMFDNLTNVMPHIQEGKITALGVACMEQNGVVPRI